MEYVKLERVEQWKRAITKQYGIEWEPAELPQLILRKNFKFFRHEVLTHVVFLHVKSIPIDQFRHWIDNNFIDIIKLDQYLERELTFEGEYPYSWTMQDKARKVLTPEEYKMLYRLLKIF